MFGPLCYYLPTAFAVAEPAARVTLSFMFILCVILSAIMLIVEAKTRTGLAKSMMWLLILGITWCLQEVAIFVQIMAITALVDELIVTRVASHYKAALIANKEIDRRS
jgi:hypothetical protein